MDRRSCGFSARVHAKNAGSGTKALIAFMILAFASAFAFADSATTPTSQPPRESPAAGKAMDRAEFLALPAYNVQYLALPSGNPLVGDRLSFKISGVKADGVTDPSKDLHLELQNDEKDAKSLDQEGWELLPPQAPPNPSQSAAPNEAANGVELRFDAVPIKKGKITLPSLALETADGKVIGRTIPFEAEVVSAIRKDDPKPEEPEDVMPPLRLAFPWWFLVILGVAGLAVVGGLVYAIIRWRAGRKGAPVIEKQEIRMSEDEVALGAFADLEKKALWARGEFKKHYFAVSEIMKVYIGRRFDFDAQESTTREIITHFDETKDLPDMHVDRLQTLMEQLDLVKFTDHKPEFEDGARQLERAREFVIMTRRPKIIGKEGAAEGAGETPGKTPQKAPVGAAQ